MDHGHHPTINNDNNNVLTQSLPPTHSSYYSVFVPPPNNTDNNKPSSKLFCAATTTVDDGDTALSLNYTKYVFDDKTEALKVVKKNKKSRFKHFVHYYDALQFAANGLEANTAAAAVVSLSPTTVTATTTVGEKPSPFKGPKPQDLVKLRKAIEIGDHGLVNRIVWENPRCLVSSGDTPSILQEGSRYNALHVAAKAKQAACCELILNTVSDVAFIKYLYGDDNCDNADARAEILLDFYLNTPDKGLNETPLHFAVKFGALSVVEVLVSFPQCDRTLKNKYGQTADMVICDRCGDNGRHESAIIKRKIHALLKNNYYVPILRADDNSLAPIIGEPFSPAKLPIVNNDPLSPRLEIHAYAGPMDRKDAEQFRRVLKTPPRRLNSSSLSLVNRVDDKLAMLRYKDHEKGLERFGQRLANQYDVNWQEYWPFLDCFVDLTSRDGLVLLEKYLATRYNTSHNNNNIITTTTTTTSYSFNNNNEILSVDCGNESTTSDISSISELCLAFNNKCNLIDCSPQQKLFSENNNHNLINPIGCIEKSCQVFANRISNDLINTSIVAGSAKDFVNCIGGVLTKQIKQFELLMSSYMEDNRFANINFQLVHCRLGMLIGRKLFVNPTSDIITTLNCYLDCYIKSFDCFSSNDDDDDDDDNNDDDNENNSFLINNYYNKELAASSNNNNNNRSTSIKKRLICLIRFIKNNFLMINEKIEENNYDDCILKNWQEMKECRCMFNVKKVRKNSSYSRSIKYNQKMSRKKLFFTSNDEVLCDKNQSVNGHNSSSDDDEFFTPPSSPERVPRCSRRSDSTTDDYYYYSDDDDDDVKFSDAEALVDEIFLEGTSPTKTDQAVYQALLHSSDTICLDPINYPYTFRWRHNVSLYSDTERKRWPCRNINNNIIKSPVNYSTPIRSSPSASMMLVDDVGGAAVVCSRSWLRITGANSPKAILKSKAVY